VSNMSIDRKLNPSLREYKMITKKKNFIEFVPKQDVDMTSNEEELLETLEELKEEYHKETHESKPRLLNAPPTPVKEVT
jgi:hypothetical protein